MPVPEGLKKVSEIRKEYALLGEKFGLKEGESMEDAIARRDSEQESRIQRLEDLLRAQSELQPLPPVAPLPASENPQDFPALFPAPINTFIPKEGPVMNVALGDMTPGYPEWFFTAHGVEKTKEHYAGRIHYLPSTIQAALK